MMNSTRATRHLFKKKCLSIGLKFLRKRGAAAEAASAFDGRNLSRKADRMGAMAAVAAILSCARIDTPIIFPTFSTNRSSKPKAAGTAWERKCMVAPRRTKSLKCPLAQSFGRPLTERFRMAQNRLSILFVTLRSLCFVRSEEHTSELQSLRHLVCRLLLE